MWWKSLVFIICLLVLVSSEEKRSKHEEKSRQGKLFTFETNDEDIKLELQFTLPFVSIPAKKVTDTFWSGAPSININPATLAVGGAIALGTTIFLPFALKSYAHLHSNQGYYRLLDSAEFSTGAFVEFASQMLANGNSLRSCSLRVACWTAQRSKREQIRAIQEFMSNSLLSTMINSTAVEEAMATGRKGKDCSAYSPCPLREEHIPVIFNNLAAFTNSLG